MALTIAVVTPSYHQGAFIERTIQSVLSQQVAGLDYFVADGGSKDQTVAILKRYDGRVRWVSEKDRGQADAVNKGIARTRGAILGWLNSDDIYYPGALAAVLEYFEAHPRIDLVFGNANHIDENDHVLEPYSTEPWNEERLREVCFLCQPAVFFRRSMVERHGGLNARLRYCMDYEYWLRLSQKGIKVGRLPQVLAGSRLHPATKTLGARIQCHREINDMMQQHCGRVPDRWLFNYAHSVLDENGVPRARQLRFALGLSVASCYASLRWNRGLSRELMRTTSEWVWAQFGQCPEGGLVMRIGFDVSQTGAARAGCGYFAYSLLTALAGCATQDDFLLYPTFGDFFWDPDWQQATYAPNLPNFSRAPGHGTPYDAQAFWCNPRDGFEEDLGNPDIIHSNNFFCPKPLRQARLVYTLYDLSFLENPDWTTEANRTGCFEGVFQASLNADHIIAISHFSKRHFLEVFPHYPEQHITVAHLASRFGQILPVERPEAFGHLEPDQFWVCVGTLEPRKNHARLLHALATLKAQVGRVAPLVLAGGKGWLVEDLSRLIESLGLSGDVMIAGYVDDSALQWLYQHCFAAVYPSLFEGFGLPVLEAMSLGAAVITSDVTSIPEIVGDAALLINPYQQDSLYDAMLRLVTSSALRMNLKARAQPQARRFRWDTAADIALQCYEQALRAPRLHEVLRRRAGVTVPAGRHGFARLAA